MISQEIARKVRHIQITARRVVNSMLGGDYTSVFRGQGIEFHDVRLYQPGDEIRTIDWNVTARTGETYIKRFVEERELTVLFAVDASASGLFGSTGRSKAEVAAELAAIIAFAAIRHNDRVGLIIFTDSIELFIPPKKGTKHVLRMVSELLSFSPKHTGTSIGKVLDFVGRVMRRRVTVFLVSDFIDSNYKEQLKRTSKHHDMVAVSVLDPHERELPNIGLILLEDAESHEKVIVDTGSKKVRIEYAKKSKERKNDLTKFLRKVGVDHIEIQTEQSWLKNLFQFFKDRESRLIRGR